MSRKFDHRRGQRGNMIIITVAFLFIVVVLCFFGYNYIHLLSGNNGQQTAIQSAALAVGQDFSRIVINTPEFGYVSLSDAAPIGQATSAGDKFYLPVRSVNTLVGAARLDYIIGDKLNAQSAGSGNVISNMATRDLGLIYNNVVPALEKVLAASIQPGGTANDINGNGH